MDSFYAYGKFAQHRLSSIYTPRSWASNWQTVVILTESFGKPLGELKIPTENVFLIPHIMQKTKQSDRIVGVLPFMQWIPHWHILVYMTILKNLWCWHIQGVPILRDKLVHSASAIDRPSRFHASPGYYACGTCWYCAFTLSGKYRHDSCLDLDLKSCWHATCMSTFVVYLICPCQLYYIGRTTRQIKVWLMEHASRLRMEMLSAPMVEHCYLLGHTFEQLNWRAIDHIPEDQQGRGNRAYYLQKREQFWIFF